MNLTSHFQCIVLNTYQRGASNQLSKFESIFHSLTYKLVLRRLFIKTVLFKGILSVCRNKLSQQTKSAVICKLKIHYCVVIYNKCFSFMKKKFPEFKYYFT